MVKMMQVAIMSLAFALCNGQATELTNTLDLDPNFKLSWEVLPTPADIVLQIQAKATGWVSLLLASDDGSYGDLIWGGYVNDTGVGYLQDMHVNLTETGHTAPEADASIDLILQGSIFHDPWTIIRVKRSLNTGDQNDVIIGQGDYTVGWSYSDSNDPSVPHTNAGFATVAFIP